MYRYNHIYNEITGKDMFMKKKIAIWELTGIIIIFFTGASLHFIFEWTGYWKPAGLIAAVNESTWEHFKMAFWPTLFYGLIQYRFIKEETHNFIVAKTVGLLIMPIVTGILFYGYTAITGHHYLIIDIIIFFLSIVSGQLVSLTLLTRETLPVKFTYIAAPILILMISAFSLLSYFPPRNFLFKHPESTEYGILSNYDHHDHGKTPSSEHENHDDHDDHD